MTIELNGVELEGTVNIAQRLLHLVGADSLSNFKAGPLPSSNKEEVANFSDCEQLIKNLNHYSNEDLKFIAAGTAFVAARYMEMIVGGE